MLTGMEERAFKDFVGWEIITRRGRFLMMILEQAHVPRLTVVNKVLLVHSHACSLFIRILPTAVFMLQYQRMYGPRAKNISNLAFCIYLHHIHFRTEFLVASGLWTSVPRGCLFP